MGAHHAMPIAAGDIRQSRGKGFARREKRNGMQGMRVKGQPDVAELPKAIVAKGIEGMGACFLAQKEKVSAAGVYATKRRSGLCAVRREEHPLRLFRPITCKPGIECREEPRIAAFWVSRATHRTRQEYAR